MGKRYTPSCVYFGRACRRKYTVASDDKVASENKPAAIVRCRPKTPVHNAYCTYTHTANKYASSIGGSLWPRATHTLYTPCVKRGTWSEISNGLTLGYKDLKSYDERNALTCSRGRYIYFICKLYKIYIGRPQNVSGRQDIYYVTL